LIAGFTGAALAYRAAGRPERSLELLSEVDSAPHTREGPTYPAFLCEMVRLACAAGDPGLAARLTEGVEAVFPYHQHALWAAGAVLLEANGDHEAAAVRHREAADRWDRFGVLPERAWALLGLGRCLLALGQAQEAMEPLREAARIFDRLGARPAFDDVNSALERAGSLAS
jgi:tetratricopeptide (TPR) repeat protein